MSPSDNPVERIFARNNVLLAPMAGVNEAPFRGICKRMGAGLTYTEMVGAKSLHYDPNGRRVRSLLSFDPAEVPCAVQIYGADPAMMAEQAVRLAEVHAGKIALIDVNMGCPVPRVVHRGEGAALIRTPDLAEAIVARVVDACPLPVTVKMRKGWDAHDSSAPDFARRMEAAGASAIAVHGRARGQFYHGEADWDAIAAVKSAVSIPVAGSGDVFSAHDALEMVERTGVDAVMIARGAQGNPWIFAEARALLDGAEPPATPGPVDRVDLALEHARALVAFDGEHAVVRMRKHVAWYTSGLKGATHVRNAANRCRTMPELDGVLGEYRAYLEAS